MAELEFPSADRHSLELRAVSELERLPGVAAAAVWLDTAGRMRDARIHVMPGVAPMIIANAASRVLHALGLAHDTDQVHLVHVPLPDEVQVAQPVSPGRHLLLQDFSSSRAGAHVTCRVQLLCGDQSVTGEARELDTPGGRARAAALATLRAAEHTNSNVALGLEAAVITSIVGRDYAVVAVEASIGRRVAELSGLAPIDPARAPEECVCIATLSALDRWLAA